VIVAGLDGTYKREAFGQILELIPISEKVKKLSAICRECSQVACFTLRLGTDAQRAAINLVGGPELYKPVCRDCFYLS